MSRTRTALYFIGSLFIFSACSVGYSAQKPVSAACAALPSDRGTASQNVTLAAGTYTIWSRIRSATPANNEFYMSIDKTNSNLLCGATIGGSTLTANTWTWVKFAVPVAVDFNTAGTFNVTMAGKDDNVEVDRVIFTGDSTCVPDNTAVATAGVNYYGENCATSETDAPVVTVTAPANNAALSGASASITGTVSDASDISSIAAFVDGSATPIAADTTPTVGAFTIPFGLSGLSVGTHTFVVKATDSLGNIGASSSFSFVIPDVTPPSLSGVSPASLTQTSATILWVTNEAADSRVEYGATTAYGSLTTLNSAKVTAHSINLTGLQAGSTYNYRVISKDAAGNSTTSPNFSFMTTAVAADTTPPTVVMTTPLTGDTVSAAVSLTATAADSGGVAGVQFQLNGANLGAEDTAAPFMTSWNTVLATNGTYTLTAIARDRAGNTKTSAPVSVTVANSSFRAEDIDRSGKVDIADFAILAGNFNRTRANMTNVRADIDGSGTVDIADFARMASRFNQ